MRGGFLDDLERSARRFPDKIAFSDGTEAFTFSRLQACAMAMGSALAGICPERNRAVCVLTTRRAADPAAFLGALYAGEHYVPLDGGMPLPRLRGIVETLRPAALVYPPALEEEARALSDLCPVLPQEEGFSHAVDRGELKRRRALTLDLDPVYIIFTSGSTGAPKGIVISHRSVIDFTDWFVEAGGFTPEDVLANQAPFHFDLSVKDLCVTLRAGASCHIIPKKLFMFPLPLLEFLDEKGVTGLLWSTSAFHLLANSGALEKRPPARLRTVMVGGEAMQARALNRWRRALPQVRYVNLYGPTETTVDCTWYPIERDFADTDPVPIGSACANHEVFLLDGDLCPVPPGQPGEICVRGAGLALGYYGDPAKTAAAFIQDPRTPDSPARVYRTGDLAVMDGAGVLTFRSRRDGQVKHLGYRVELGEIETALHAIPEVEEAVCLFDPERDKLLCVYTGSGTADDVARAARARLPRYMVPNLYRRRDAMPRNANGKTDRPALRREYLSGDEPNG